MRSLAYNPNYALNAICPYFTMFPLEYPLRVLKKHRKDKPVVLDPFCGRGTTLFAARSLGLESWAAAGCIDTNLSFSSLLELYGTDVAQCRMPARRVVEALDVIEDIGPCLLATSVHLAGRPLGLH